MSNLASLKLKKGSTVFIYGNWNGFKEATIDFYIQEYTIYSIGKKQCYLLLNNGSFSKMWLSPERCEVAALTFADALTECKEYITIRLKQEREGLNNRIKYGTDKHYILLMNELLNNLNTAEVRIISNPYTTDTKNII